MRAGRANTAKQLSSGATAPGRWSAVRPVLAELSVQPESAHRVTQAHGDLHDVSHEFAHTADTHPALLESKREQQPFI